MKSCKKCTFYKSKDSFCKSFYIHISSTLNATHCTRYCEKTTKCNRSKKYPKSDLKKRKKAKICISCDFNQEGYCSKYKRWCNTVNDLCCKQ